MRDSGVELKRHASEAGLFALHAASQSESESGVMLDYVADLIGALVAITGRHDAAETRRLHDILLQAEDEALRQAANAQK